MKKVFITKNPSERDSLIERLYHENIVYRYTDKDREGNYKIEYDEDIKRTDL